MRCKRQRVVLIKLPVVLIVLQTLMASDNSVLNVDDTRYNPAASH